SGPITDHPAIGSAPRVPFAGVAELVDARDLGSRDESRGGSNPSARTTVTQGAAAGLKCPVLQYEQRRERRRLKIGPCRSQKLSATVSSANSRSRFPPPISRPGWPAG